MLKPLAHAVSTVLQGVKSSLYTYIKCKGFNASVVSRFENQINFIIRIKSRTLSYRKIWCHNYILLRVQPLNLMLQSRLFVLFAKGVKRSVSKGKRT